MNRYEILETEKHNKRIQNLRTHKYILIGCSLVTSLITLNLIYTNLV